MMERVLGPIPTKLLEKTRLVNLKESDKLVKYVTKAVIMDIAIV